MRVLIALVLGLWAGSGQAADLQVWDVPELPTNLAAPIRCLAEGQDLPIILVDANVPQLSSSAVVAIATIGWHMHWAIMIDEGPTGAVARETYSEKGPGPLFRAAVPDQIRELAELCRLSWSEPFEWPLLEENPSVLDRELEAGLPLLPQSDVNR